MAADLIRYRTPQFETWLRNMVETYRDPENHNNTIEEIFYRRANNWGTQAFGTLCTVYGYLRDTAKLVKIRNYWIQMVTGPNPGATYGSDISWHTDQNNLRLINIAARRTPVVSFPSPVACSLLPLRPLRHSLYV